jgi:hypothetical protein
MTKFHDLSPYVYRQDYARPRTRNVGWLGSDDLFQKAVPNERDLDLLWAFCKVSVAQTRGVHPCELGDGKISYRAGRKGETLLLGTSEIRVFSPDGDIFAAPTMLYHYVCAHSYNPPPAFLKALREGPRPPDADYFERLKELDLEWNPTTQPSPTVKPR